MRAHEIFVERAALPVLGSGAKTKIMHLWKKYDTGDGRPIAPLSEFGFTQDERDLPKQFMYAIQQNRTKLKALGFPVVDGESKIVHETIPVSKLVPQHDFVISNLLTVLKHWNEAPLPELVALPDGRYWIMEGHHRIVLQILMGAKSIEAMVDHDPLVLGVGNRADLDEKAQQPQFSDAFKAWFRNSKVVDSNGLPLKCFHAARANFGTFKHDNDTQKVMGTSHGFYFTANPAITQDYLPDEGGNVMPVYLRIENPMILNAYSDDDDFVRLLGPKVREINDYSQTYGGRFPDRAQTYFFFKDAWGPKLIALAKAKGYDGVIFPEKKISRYERDLTFVAFDANQIKSALNKGTFDPENDDVSEEIQP